jgi:hypothetical protein
MSVYMRVFEELPAALEFHERGFVDEVIVNALLFARTGCSGRIGNREADSRLALEQ